MAESKPFTILALSDATGELAHMLSVAAVNQFDQHKSKIIRVPKMTGTEKIKQYVIQAKGCHGVIIFTFVSSEMRQELLRLAKEYEVVAIDVMGPTLDALANYFHELPSREPGLQYKMTRHYFERTEAVEFTVKHDDGLGLDTLQGADILLLGISRTSKTPLSIYLAYHGFRCANIPVIKDMPLPAIVKSFDSRKIIALTVSAAKLATIRSMRLKKLGRSDMEAYASLEYIQSEISYANHIFQDLNLHTIDVTAKAIEETASEIITVLKL